MVSRPTFVDIPPNCKLWWLASILSSNFHRLPIHSLVPVGVSFLAFTAITVDRFLAHKLHLRYHVAVTHTRAALVVALIWKVNGWISSMRLWNRNTVAVTTLLCLLGSFVAYWRIFGIVRSYNSKTSDTDSLPRVGACAWKTAPDDVTVENVDLEYVLCLLYFLFLPHSACFLHGCLVRHGKMVVSHCW